MKKSLSIFLLMIANLALLSHVLVPHHHHGAVEIVVASVSGQASPADCPVTEGEGGAPDECIIAEADIFLVRNTCSLPLVFFFFFFETLILEPLASCDFCLPDSNCPLPLKTILLPAGLRAPPMC